MDTNFIALLIGVLFMAILIKSIINFKQNKAQEEQFDIHNRANNCKYDEGLKNHVPTKAYKNKVINLEERRKQVARKKSKNVVKHLSVKNETLKFNSVNRQWWI